MPTNFPNSVDTFEDKVDEDIPQEESLTIPGISPFQLQLGQKPKGPSRGQNGVIVSSSVFIVGMKEVEGTPQVSGQYNVDYNTGVISFNPNDKTKAIIIQYLTAGDPITAEDFNDLQDSIVALEEFCLHPYLKDENSVKWYLKVDQYGALFTSSQP